jgi:hypothetical protein
MSTEILLEWIRIKEKAIKLDKLRVGCCLYVAEKSEIYFSCHANVIYERQNLGD